MGKRGRKASGNKLGQRDNRKGWSELQKDNADWQTYYKSQGLIPEDQFELFKTTCQQPLPLTFRVTGSRKHAKEISALYRDNILPKLQNVDVEGYKKPFTLPWYPEQMGFQIDLPKHVIRKTPEYKEVQKFLFNENEVGNISRQEAVSMIPPLVLDVEPHHHVLDMCAAPGSKTAQLIESLHTFKDSSDPDQQPTGFVMANDSDYKRSYMLVHQIKRLNSPNVVIVNHDAQMFPNMILEENGRSLKFDRILCDVPCSGDGTMRKNIMVWREWKAGNGLGLHKLQLNILKRGLQMLKPGGRLVYSTCSTNPIENEAVVAAAIKAMGNIKTVDCSDRLPGLVRHKGVSTWKVYGKDMKEREPGAKDVAETVFPPSESEAADFHLENCMRVYPHDQNTGGFFITCLEKSYPESSKKREASETAEPEEVKKQKTDENEENENGGAESDLTTPQNHVKQNKKKMPRDANEEPFKFLEPENAAIQQCFDFYGIDSKFPRDTFLVRNATGEALATIYHVAPVIKQILQLNDKKFKFIYTGVKMFISQKVEACPWRVSNDGLVSLKRFLPESRQINTNLEAFKVLLTNDRAPVDLVNHADNAFVISELGNNAFFVKVNRGEDKEEMLYPAWKGGHCYNLMVNKHECAELLYRLYGIDKAEMDKEKAAKEEAKKAATITESSSVAEQTK